MLQLAIFFHLSSDKNLAFLFRYPCVLLVVSVRAFVRERAYVHVLLKWVSNREVLCLFYEFLQKLILHFLVHIDSGTRAAFLACVAKRSFHYGLCRLAYICALCHYRRIFAP